MLSAHGRNRERIVPGPAFVIILRLGADMDQVPRAGSEPIAVTVFIAVIGNDDRYLSVDGPQPVIRPIAIFTCPEVNNAER